MTRSDAPLGVASKTNYDLDGLVTSEQALLGASTWLTTSYTYTPTGKVETTTDPEDNITRTTHDGLGRTDITIDAELRKTQSVYLTSARWKPSTVDGFRIMADLNSREGRIQIAHSPTMTRSIGRRLGARTRERLRTTS